jgi:hypothetical protein
MVETLDTTMDEGDADLAVDPVALERAVQRASIDLQRIVVLLAQPLRGPASGIAGAPGSGADVAPAPRYRGAGVCGFGFSGAASSRGA